MTKRLRELVAGFREDNPDLADSRKARGCYTVASYAFHNILVVNSLRPSLWEIVLDDKHDHDRHLCPEWYPDIDSEGHCVNYVEGVVIDWTARQYNSEAPFPLIFRPLKMKPKPAGLERKSRVRTPVRVPFVD